MTPATVIAPLHEELELQMRHIRYNANWCRLRGHSQSIAAERHYAIEAIHGVALSLFRDGTPEVRAALDGVLLAVTAARNELKFLCGRYLRDPILESIGG